MEPTESITTIKRVLLEPDTARRMLEPDFDKERPICCKDVMILYATTEPTDYEPLTQTAIELSPKLSTRGPNKPDVRNVSHYLQLKARLNGFNSWPTFARQKLNGCWRQTASTPFNIFENKASVESLLNES